MKIVKLKNRLGNQMFMYAFAKALEHYTGDDVYFDITECDNVMPEIFNVEMKIASFNDINKLALKTRKYPFIFEKIQRKLGIKISEKNPTEPRINCYCPELLNINEDKYYEGYYQTEKYFKSIEYKIRNDFSFKTINDEKLIFLRNKIKSCENPVFIHVRRGDYVDLHLNNHHHWLCSLSYYKEATDYIINKIPSATFFAVSDDTRWLRDNLKIDYPFEIISSNTDFFDIYLLTACKHGIVANSSYSWWGAWLIDNPEKIICAPEPWFEPSMKNEIICENWHKIPRSTDPIILGQ